MSALGMVCSHALPFKSAWLTIFINLDIVKFSDCWKVSYSKCSCYAEAPYNLHSVDQIYCISGVRIKIQVPLAHHSMNRE